MSQKPRDSSLATRRWSACSVVVAVLAVVAAAALPAFAQAPVIVSGVVRAAGGAPIPGAEVAAGPGARVETADNGTFTLTLLPGRHTLTVTRRGYAEATVPVEVTARAATVDVVLEPLARFDENVTVSAVRAPADAPVTKRDIPRAEIEARNYGQEMPFLLSQVPSVTQYADSGAPSGYSYLYLRGIPQTRMNVTIDGMPINEPEDSAFYFSNFGDFANAVDSIQVQRGVGTSSVGAASFVGSINFASAAFAERAGASARVGAGSFGTRRVSAALHSGEVGGGVRLYAQAAAQESDGFREHSGVSQRSVYLGAMRGSGASFFKVFGFIGRERAELAYLAADEATLAGNLRANPLSPDERDDFGQHFVTAQYHRALGAGSELSVQGFYNGADGWYRIANASAAPSGLFEYGLTWHNAGGSATYRAATARTDFTWGTFASAFESQHSREVVDGPADYANHGYKYEVNTFAKVGWSGGRWRLLGDAQIRWARFRYAGSLDLGDVEWTFFNPKAGVRYDAGHGVSLYASLGRGSREPARSDMLHGEDNPTIPYDLAAVKPEAVVDAEFGANVSFPRLSAQVNGYLMSFRDEIAQTGELSEIGLPLRRNVDRSSRRGVEVDVAWRPWSVLQVRHTANYSLNRIDAWTQFYDVYDVAGDWVGSTSVTHTDVPPYVTPGVLVTLGADYTPTTGATVGGAWRYVGESHLDNTGHDDFTAPAFSSVDLNGTLDLARLLSFAARAHPVLRLQVNNLLDNRRMFPGGYSYQYFVADGAAPTASRVLEGTRYYYPLATRGAYLALELRF